MKSPLIKTMLAALVLAGSMSADVPRQDGLSPETAVVIVAKNETDGPPQEILWIREKFPGSKVLRFVTRPSTHGKVFDVFLIKTKDGQRPQVYFEISSFYHKT